ncbi:MAG: aminoacyl-tRNA hydrolase [Candidatus Pacebacteria bacterium]|nr:aminoacyl-tRNA hydrolase [Candidatus Paceibacterota bacterium]
MHIFDTMKSMNYIIVGLGNPEKQYADTRHNAGRMVLEAFRSAHDLPEWENRKELKARKTEGVAKENIVILLQPDDHMNNSGKSIAKYMKDISEEEHKDIVLIVVHDDIDLPLGTFKIVYNRGSGGHKGVASMEQELKTRDFIRVRVGIAPLTFFGNMRKPKGTYAVQKHVLKKFTRGEFQKLELVLKNCTKALLDIMDSGVDKAMNTWNSK